MLMLFYDIIIIIIRHISKRLIASVKKQLD